MTTIQLDSGLLRTDAPSGATILSEHMQSVRSVAIGIWVRSASAHEPRRKMGVSHLLEHMVFKGTERRSAKGIALALESRGGALDGFTGRDQTTFQARVLDADLSCAVDILTDIVQHPVLRSEDLALERKVVLEEIAQVEDTPDDLVFDLHAKALWPEHSYGYTILGTRETVCALGVADLKELHRRAYYPGNCVVAAAGHADHERLLQLLGTRGWLDAPHTNSDKRPTLPAVPPAARGVEQRVERPLQQTHIVLGTDTVPYADRRRIAIALVSTVLGGGMSSRLFQRVREELGLAYSVHTFHAFYLGTGVWGVYLGAQPDSAPEAVAVIRSELARLAREGLHGEELQEAKQQLKGQLTISIESPAAKMNRLAALPLYGERFRTVDELLAEIDVLTEEEVAAAAAEFFDPDRQSTVWLGPSQD